jgi:hypothetical protein
MEVKYSLSSFDLVTILFTLQQTILYKYSNSVRKYI